jgi:hypothetical protein
MNRTILLASFLLIGCTAVAVAQDDPCASPLSYEQYVFELTEQISEEMVGTATATATIATANQLVSRANADGLTSNRLDLLHRAFVAVGLGQVDEEDGQLVFNFNPEALAFPIGQFTPRVIVRSPELYTGLDQQLDSLPEANRPLIEDSFEKQLGDLDDVEVQVRWTNASGTPDVVLQELASDIFQPAYLRAAQPEFQALSKRELEFRALIEKALEADAAANAPGASTLPPDVKATLVRDICSVEPAKEHLLQLVPELRAMGKKGLTALGEALKEDHFFDLADLIDGEPHFTIESAYRRREDAAGPDVRSVSLRYEFGNISFRNFKEWANEGQKGINAASVQEYLSAQKAPRALPKFSVSVEYSESTELRIPLAEGTPDFFQPEAYKLSGVARAGWFFGGGRDRRLEFEATYDDVSDDPARQDRFIGELSWVEKLSGLAQAVAGSDLVVTLVYANKPEFRGEVDEELGLRFGLKWAFGNTVK